VDIRNPIASCQRLIAIGSARKAQGCRLLPVF
jgi:hypothetical protein